MNNNAFRAGIAVALVSVVPFLSKAEFVDQCPRIFGAIFSAALKTSLTASSDPHYNQGVVNSTRLSEAETVWTGGHWTFDHGGIARRLNSYPYVPQRLLNEDANGALLSSADVITKLKGMSQAELDLLSPAEKADVALGYYDFRITKLELEQRGPRRTLPPEPWEGFCNGLCAASINQPEPVKVVEITNPDGIVIRFQPAEIKGLLVASYFYVEDYAAAGAPKPLGAGVDAGAFDVALTRHLGEGRRGFVVDIDPSIEIWNHVAVGYTRQPGLPTPVAQPTATMPAGTTQVSRVTTQVNYVREVNEAYSNTPSKANVAAGRHDLNKNYVYDLYLDANERILGGAWISSDYPDFAWFPRGKGTDSTAGEAATNPHLPFTFVEDLAQKAKQ